MKVHYDLSSLPQFKDAIVTMGAFDGVHKGHQQIIQRMKQLAQNVQGETIIITFHPEWLGPQYKKDQAYQLCSGSPFRLHHHGGDTFTAS